VQLKRFPFPTFDKSSTRIEILHVALLLEILVCIISIARDVTYDKETGMKVCFYVFHWTCYKESFD